MYGATLTVDSVLMENSDDRTIRRLYQPCNCTNSEVRDRVVINTCDIRASVCDFDDAYICTTHAAVSTAIDQATFSSVNIDQCCTDINPEA